MPCLLVIAGPNDGQMYELDSNEYVIGRGDGCCIQFVDEKASRNHCKLLCVPGNTLGGSGIASKQWAIEDMGSSNGTTLDGCSVEGKAIMKDGAMIGIGTSKAIFLTDTYESMEEAREYADNIVKADVTQGEESWPLDPPWMSKTLGEE